MLPNDREKDGHADPICRKTYENLLRFKVGGDGRRWLKVNNNTITRTIKSNRNIKWKKIFHEYICANIEELNRMEEIIKP